MTTKKQSQSDKFKKTARDLECDESEERWEKRLKKVAKRGGSSVEDGNV